MVIMVVVKVVVMEMLVMVEVIGRGGCGSDGGPDDDPTRGSYSPEE